MPDPTTPVTVDALLAKSSEVAALTKKAADTRKAIVALTKRADKEEAAAAAATKEYDGMKAQIDKLVAKGK